MESLRSNRKEQGFTLIEMIVVVALAAIMLGGMAYYIIKGFSSNKIKSEAAAITNVIGALAGARAEGISGQMIRFLRPRNEIPPPWLPGSGPLAVNSFGGSVRIVGTSGDAKIMYEGAPQEACNKLVVRISRNARVHETQVNGKDPRISPVTPAEAESDCDAEGNAIVWTIR